MSSHALDSLVPSELPDDLAPQLQPEEQWVAQRLVHSLLSNASYTQWMALGVAAIMAALVLPFNDYRTVLIWGAVSITVSAWRLYMLASYNRAATSDGARSHVDFMGRFAWTYPLSAVVWGSSILLFLERGPAQGQFVCWLIMIGLATFSVMSFCPHKKVMQNYLDALVLSTLLVLLYCGAQMGSEAMTRYAWAGLLIAMYWQLLRRTGLRLHGIYKRNYQLLYRNERLVETLTQQTKAAMEASETKSRFFASAAHDIRQPVHALGLYADWLANEPELAQEIGPKIRKATQAVNTMFDSLFDLARMEERRIGVRLQTVNLREFFHDLDVQYRPLAQDKGLALRLMVCDGSVRSDPLLLQRIMGNLLANAIKYTPSGGVLLAARRQGDRVSLQVWDTGIGIDTADQRQVFKEFYKVNADGGSQEGFGLGLPIVRRLCVMLGYPLRLRSRPGRGSVFKVELKAG